jgi:hypothetical protein
MPVITDALIKSSEQMKEGWTQLKILEAKAVSKDGYTNDIVVLEGLAGPGNGDENVGRRISHIYFGKALDASNPVPEVIDNMLKFLAAATKMSITEVKATLRGEINFNAFAGKVVWGRVADTVNNGKIYKNVAEWAPEDVVPF